MRLTVNGKDLQMPVGVTIAELVGKQGFNPEVIVIEHNQQIVKKEEWQATVLQPEDCLEVVTFVGGG
ncbi:sulfur carrier protein ThiS [Sporomusa termitida]|uniref:ThiS: thiamine biosynthesis protein ThiS n=1 Tax=Sporomusa termitida TaxID=2377 RepID=A0A517DU82_9FIRM|nr:sulfur carrier protein ThiS [Sporomusa termitida]QDR80914.1 thiS: thiamine biosynthesis protein ThiS [Sporomusa termitida]